MLSQGEENFISVIDETDYCLLAGNILFKPGFLAVNKQNIILIADHLLAPPSGQHRLRFLSRWMPRLFFAHGLASLND